MAFSILVKHTSCVLSIRKIAVLHMLCPAQRDSFIGIHPCPSHLSLCTSAATLLQHGTHAGSEAMRKLLVQSELPSLVVGLLRDGDDRVAVAALWCLITLTQKCVHA